MDALAAVMSATGSVSSSPSSSSASPSSTSASTLSVLTRTLAASSTSPSLAAVFATATPIPSPPVPSQASPDSGAAGYVAPAFQIMLDIQSWIAEHGLLCPCVLPSGPIPSSSSSSTSMSSSSSSTSLTNPPSSSGIRHSNSVLLGLSLTSPVSTAQHTVPCVMLTPTAVASLCPPRHLLTSSASATTPTPHRSPSARDAAGSTAPDDVTLGSPAVAVSAVVSAFCDANKCAPTIVIALAPVVTLINNTDVALTAHVIVERACDNDQPAAAGGVGTNASGGGGGGGYGEGSVSPLTIDTEPSSCIVTSVHVPSCGSARGTFIAHTDDDGSVSLCLSMAGCDVESGVVKLTVGGACVVAAVPVPVTGASSVIAPFGLLVTVLCELVKSDAAPSELRVTISPRFVLHNTLVRAP